jgi:hypothetical protein
MSIVIDRTCLRKMKEEKSCDTIPLTVLNAQRNMCKYRTALLRRPLGYGDIIVAKLLTQKMGLWNKKVKEFVA